MWRAGYLYGTGGDTLRSRQTFTRLADAYPDHEWTANGLFMAASAAARDEDWSSAEQLYTRLASLTGGEDKAAAQLWLGRIALGRGDEAAANEAFALAMQAAPDSYFAARASDFRIGRQPFQPTTALQFDFDRHAELAAADDWLRSAFAVTDQGDLWRMTPQLEADSNWRRGQELFAVGAYDEALGEFSAALDAARNAGKSLDSYRLAIALRDMGAYRESIVAAADVIIASGQGTLHVAPAVARLRFPAYYSDLIVVEARERGFDPLLMLSLIRQESLFNTYATAAAGEKGITPGHTLDRSVHRREAGLARLPAQYPVSSLCGGGFWRLLPG